LSGYSADEVIGQNCRFMQGPRTDPESVSKIREALQKQEEITVELLNYRKDGSTFWNELVISPVHDDEGTLLYFFSSSKDVSKRRQARELELDERRLLLEIDHRAKNALALVQGFVRLSRSDDPEVYAASVQSRVDALARAHSMLASHGWRGVPLMRLVQGEAEPFGARRVIPSGPEILIGSRQVQPLSLFFQEMLSNASKHGALSVPGGEVAIEWKQESDGAIVIDWEERGGPAPGRVERRSFGSALINQIISRQLGGKSSMEWEDAGLKARFSFSLA
jgi:PAS domain S-box-containing protein